MADTPQGYAEWARFESEESEEQPYHTFWRGGAEEDKEETRFGINHPITLHPGAYPTGTRIIIYVPIDENAEADWPQY